MPHTPTSKSQIRQRKAFQGVVPRFMSFIKCTRTSSNNTDHINNDKANFLKELRCSLLENIIVYLTLITTLGSDSQVDVNTTSSGILGTNNRTG